MAAPMTKRSTISCHGAVTNTDSAQPTTSTTRSRAYIFSRPMRSVRKPNTLAPKKIPINDAAPMSPDSVVVGLSCSATPSNATPMMLIT